MMDSQEPRDGDFVAYVEALQRESEARLHLRPQHPVGVPAHPADATESHGIGRSATSRIGTPTDAATPVLNRKQADELLARLSRSGAQAQVRGGGIALAVGVVLLLYWFIADGGAIPFLVGLALTLGSISRLRRLGQPGPDTGQHARGQTARFFGQRPPRA